MGYRVEYPSQKQPNQLRIHISTVSVLTILFLTGFYLLVNYTWPRGAEVMKLFLFSEELVISASALDDMALQLQSGEDFLHVIATFWDRLLQFFG